MKKLLVVLVAMMMVLAMVGGAFAAPDSTAVPVSATVTDNCRISGGSITFGNVDAITGGTATVVQPTLYCTSGASVTVSDDMGLNEVAAGVAPPRMTDGTNYLNYSFNYTKTALAGTGINTNIPIALSASIATADLADVPAGSYEDTITLTIAY